MTSYWRLISRMLVCVPGILIYTVGMLGATQVRVCAALSQAIIDGHSLRICRQAPHAGPRKSWAAGDAVRRGLYLAGMTCHGVPNVTQAIHRPIEHPDRRAEVGAFLLNKQQLVLFSAYSQEQCQYLLTQILPYQKAKDMPIDTWLEQWIVKDKIYDK